MIQEVDYTNPIPSSPVPQGEQSGPPRPPEALLDLADIDKAIPAGLARGITGTIGLPGTIGDFTRAAANKASEYLPNYFPGAIEAGAQAARNSPMLRAFTGPSGSDVQHKLEEYTGKLYEPTSTGGQWANTAAEFAPGAILGPGRALAKGVNWITGTTGSEGAGQLTKGTAAEPWARALGGVTGGVVGGKIVTPIAPPTRTYQEAVNVLKDARVPLSAGDKLDSRMLRMMESVAGDSLLSAGLRKQQLRDQAAGLNRAYTEKAFDPAALSAPPAAPGGRPPVAPDATLPRRDVMAKGVDTLSDEYNRLSVNPLYSDQRLMQGLRTPQTAYEAKTLPSARKGGSLDLETIRNEIVDKLLTNASGGRAQIPGSTYQSIRSNLSDQSNTAFTAGNAPLGTALRSMRQAMDEAMARGLSPQDAAAWAKNNERWGNMKQLERAVAQAPGENLTAAGVAASVRAGRSGPYARGAGDLDELTNAARTVLQPLPNSNTAPRSSLQNLPTNIMTLGGAVPLAVISKPGQRWLGNQAAPQSVRDILTHSVLQQGATQPSGIERTEAADTAYERKRRQDLIDLGLASGPDGPEKMVPQYTAGDKLPYYQR